MYKDQRVLVVIPARGGSKGIPRKNLRLVNGLPLISYVIKKSLQSEYVDKVVVSTDDEEIAAVSTYFGASIIHRPDELAGDSVPLDPVIYHAVDYLEKNNEKYDLIITLQPTLPLISEASLNKGIAKAVDEACDTVIGVTDETHLYWRQKEGAFEPCYLSRVNRQQLLKMFKECGFFVSKRSVVEKNNRIGGKVSVIELPRHESIDVDSYEDMWLVEGILRKRKVAIRVEGNKEIGLGHIYRMLSLAGKMMTHDVVFYTTDNSIGYDVIKSNNYIVYTIKGDEDFISHISENDANIVINDILDTSEEYIRKLNDLGVFVVNFEDMGEGTLYADMVINALYENSYPEKNSYYGYKYCILKQDFYYYNKKQFKSSVETILLTFGGVDENDLTYRILAILDKIGYDGKVKVILGLGYSDDDHLRELIKKTRLHIELHKNVRSMAEHIYNSDLVITSNGRTIYEVASLGVPIIAISQNEREMKHLYSQINRGIVNLGLAKILDDQKIEDSISKMLNDAQYRKKCYSNIVKDDLKQGLDNVINLITYKYDDLHGTHNS